ncbi:MAG: AAC(3) family N-acetyltransferase [Defluviitaleaceae bacterium]|nr:AAC(3) family N-acetyltransferase [Defluviitaleaceae bacterium]
MHTKNSLIADLKTAGINPSGTLMIHSSCKSVGVVEGRGDTILDAFIDFMRDGLLIFPTHTWEYVMNEGFDENGAPVGKNNIFDYETMPSCVGILPNLFLKRPGVIRSMHPTHSVAAIGTKAAEFTDGEEFTQSPCPRNGCHGKLYDRGAQILFLGCELTKNTYLHGVEEWYNVPGRLTEKPQEIFIRRGGELIPCPQYRHHFSGGNVSDNYDKAEKLFIENGAATYCKIGDAHSVLCDAVKMADLIGEILKNEPDYFASGKLKSPS